MSIKAGSVAQLGDAILLDRIQTGGPGQINIPEEKIEELGDYQSVGYVLDTPDVTYSLESFDAGIELEEILLGLAPGSTVDHGVLDLSLAKPLDVVGLFKPGKTAASPDVAVGCAVAPYLALESLEYRFGITDNGQVTGSLRGDSIYYNRGSAYTETFAAGAVLVTNKALASNVATLTVGTGHGFSPADKIVVVGVDSTFNGSYTLTGTTTTTISYAKTAADVTSVAASGAVSKSEFTLAHLAYPYNGDTVTGTRYALSVSDSDGQRYRANVDYTETVTGSGFSKTVKVVLTGTQLPTVGGAVKVSYASSVGATVSGFAADGVTRPAAVKGRNIVVKIDGVVWADVQSVSAGIRFTLDSDRELGNDNVVSRDFDTPDVSGSLQIKPRKSDALMDRLKIITGVSSDYEVMGALQRASLPLDIELHSPTDGSVIKTIYCPDARFTLPGYSGRVRTKTTFDMNFTSPTGVLEVIRGTRV